MKIEKEIMNLLEEKELYVDGVYFNKSKRKYPTNVLEIEIDGDWKHEHMCLDSIMQSKGYKLIDKVYNEEPMDDCYSATHIYVKFSMEFMEA